MSEDVVLQGVWFAIGLLLGLWIGVERENRFLRRLQFGSSVPVDQGPRSLMDEELEAARAIAPPRDVIRPEEIDRGAEHLLALARQEGRELSREDARHQASIMLMQERGIIED